VKAGDFNRPLWRVLCVATLVAIATAALALLAPRGVSDREACSRRLCEISGVLVQRANLLAQRPEGASDNDEAKVVPVGPGAVVSFLCPADPRATGKGGEGEGDRRFLTSYVVRDLKRFPLNPEDHGPLALAACLLHPGGANILFSTGEVRFLRMDELGLPEEAPLVAGPDSPSPLLRVLRR
jgi:hypothetical protein